jgi:RNA polymerase sigma factor (sigma-70 family)
MGSEPIITDWLLLRTALWRVGERPIAFEAVNAFRTAANEQPDGPLPASLERVDPTLERLDAYCSALVPGRTRSSPVRVADDDERRRVLVWLAENQWKNMRLVALGVLRQQSGGHSIHSDMLEEILQEFIGLGPLDAVLAGYDPLFRPLLGYVLFCFKRACMKHLRRSGKEPLGATDTRDAEALLSNIRDGRPSPEDEIEKRSLAKLVWRMAESNLPSRRFHALRLRYKEGLTDEQIGQQLAIGKKAAKQLVHNARNELKEILKIVGVL